jgi:hypothetical protein
MGIGKVPTHKKIERLIELLDSGVLITTRSQAAKLLGYSFVQVRDMVDFLKSKQRITFNQHGHWLVLSASKKKPAIKPLEKWEIEEARVFNHGALKHGRYAKRNQKPQGWLRAIIMNESEKMLATAPPSDPVLSQQIIESKGIAVRSKPEPVKYPRLRLVKQVAQPRTLPDPLLAPGHERARRLAMLERQELLDLQREAAIEEERAEARRRKARLAPKKLKKYCWQCQNMPHRRPEIGKCRCGMLYAPEMVGIEIGSGSGLSAFDSW